MGLEFEKFRWEPLESAVFAGRQSELSQVLAELRSAGGREINISGPPGIGKTALISAAVRELGEVFPDGIFYIQASGLQQESHGLRGIEQGARLLVVDDLAPEHVPLLLRTATAIATSQSAGLVTASRSPVSLTSSTVHVALTTFTQAEAYELASMFAHPSTPERFLQSQFLDIFHGHPLGLSLALELINSGRFDIAQLRELLRPFDASGILDPQGVPLRSSDDRFDHVVSSVIEVDDKLIEAIASKPTLMYELQPRKFEELIAELLHRQGFEVHVTPATNDGGRDIFAASHSSVGQFLYFVECKRYAADKPVSVGVVRGLHGVVQAHQATAGIVVTTSYFSRYAREFQERVPHQLSLRDYLAVSQWLEAAKKHGGFRGDPGPSI